MQDCFFGGPVQTYSQAKPLSLAKPSIRVDYLKKVMAWTSAGLFFSGLTGTMMAAFLHFSGLTFLLSPMVSLVVILGCFGLAQYVAPKMVFGQQKLAGFLMANVAQGVAMGYLLLSAAIMGQVTSGSPFGLIGTALGLTALTAGGMWVYVMSGPKDFSMLGGILSAFSLPMLVLMAIGFVAGPSMLGGVVGILFYGVFVAFSAGALLYQVNIVIHKLRTDQHIEGSYLISMGILILFWNILSLLMSMSRD